MALKGTLKDFGVADILQLIGQQQKTGVLYVKSKQEEVEVSFQNGQVVRSLSRTRRNRELLGMMMVHAGMIGEDVLEDVLATQKRTLKRIGDILVAEGRISAAQLREMMQLQTTETVFRLFEWNNGTYEFVQQDVEIDAAQGPPIRSESILMEGFRRIDEWPLIKRRLPTTDLTFERARLLAPPAPERAGAGDDVDSAFDAVLGGGRKPAPAPDPTPKSIGANERRVYGLAEPDLTVQHICDVSRLGEFETCKALFNLIEAGYLRTQTSSRKKGGRTATVPRVRSASLSDGVTRALGGTWLQVVAGFLLVCGYVLAVRGPAAAEEAFRPTEMASSGPRQLLVDGQMARLSSALELYRVNHGRYPKRLNELVVEDLLENEELKYPFETQYAYRTEGDSYLLLPPLR